VGGLAVGAGLITATSYLAINDESQDPVVDRIPLAIKNLHPTLEGFTIVQITDVHLYPMTQPDLVEKSVIIGDHGERIKP